MRIIKVKVNGFGNLKNIELEFSDKMNLICGENESGKSTLVAFIKAMFYGINKNKSGEEFSEYERYKPWSGEEFSGKVEYELDGKMYSAVRDFNNNACKVYDSEGTEITKQFSKDKSRGVELGTVCFGVDEQMFENSLLVRQSKIKVDDTEQRSVIQKITNIIQSGNEGMSYEKVRSRLEKKIVDEIGTSRTRNKPINILYNEIETLEQEKEKLLYNRKKSEEIIERQKRIEDEKLKLKEKSDFLSQVIKLRSEYEAKIKENHELQKLTHDVNEKRVEEELKRLNKTKKISVYLITAIGIILCVVCLLLNQYMFVPVVAVVTLAIVFIYGRRDLKAKIDIDTKDFEKIDSEIIAKQSLAFKELEIDDTFINMDISKLKSELNNNEKMINDKILEEHKLSIELESIKEDVDRLNEIETKLLYKYEEKEKLELRGRVLELALEMLDKSYKELKDGVMPKFLDILKNTIYKCTNNKYDTTIYNDKSGLMVQKDNGELISIEKLSIGTIDQIYLGFRIALAGNVDTPLIFDEAFVFFDDERLKNLLNILNEMSNIRQIIVLSCSEREKENITGKIFTL